VLDKNPAEDAAGPDGGTDKQKPFLRPDEILRLLSCELVALERRHVYAVALYTGTRQGELRGLRVRDVDLDAMQITVVRQMKNGKVKDRAKTGRARIVQIEPNLVPLLRVLMADKDGDEPLLCGRAHNRCASHLREDLMTAGSRVAVRTRCLRRVLSVAVAGALGSAHASS
jgi:integrase